MLKQKTKSETCNHDEEGTCVSIERQVRIASGLLVLVGIALAYSVYLPFIWMSILVALGMVLSGITNSCALGLLIKQMPWNQQKQ